MLIDLDLLSAHGGTIHTYDSHDYIFQIEETPRCYYQIVSGDVKLNYTNEEGKELIQSFLTKGESVCELLLFVDEKYPVNAVTISDCTIMKVPKAEFIQMLDEHPHAAVDVLKYISKTLYNKFIMMQNIASTSAEQRIRGTLKYFKSFFPDKTPFSYEVKLTRQQFASITGLRTETVIRTLKKLEKEGFVKIEDRKVYF